VNAVHGKCWPLNGKLKMLKKISLQRKGVIILFLSYLYCILLYGTGTNAIATSHTISSCAGNNSALHFYPGLSSYHHTGSLYQTTAWRVNVSEPSKQYLTFGPYSNDVCVCTCVCVFVCLYIYVCECMYISVCMCMYAYIVEVYACMYVCMYV